MKNKMKQLFGILLSLVLALGLMPRMSMTVQARTEETLLTTVTYTNGGSQTHSTEGVVTVTLNGVTDNDDTYGWLFYGSGTVTVTPVDGVEITKVRFIQNAKNPLDDDKTPFELSFTANQFEPSLRGATVETSDGAMRNGQMDGVTSIEVYGYKTIEEYTVTYKVINGTWDGTSTADKTETVASGGNPASVPTGMKANSGYTGGSWDTDPSTATISADTTFTYTFVADSSSGGDSSESGSGDSSGGSSDNTNTNTDTSAKVPYEEVPISTGYVKDITGTAAATAESNSFGTKIENNNDLQNVLGIEDADVAQGVNVWLDIQDNSANVPEAEKTLVEAASEDYTVGLFLDINLFMKVGNNAAMKVASTNGKVKASIVIPESLWKSGRTFEIIRVHDGEATAIPGSYDADSHVFTFETDKFSTYALAYKDTETASSGSSSSASTVSYPKTTAVYRLFNTKNGQHFYTANKEEHDILVTKGWNDEGIAWQVRATTAKPIYRLFDKFGTGNHLFTSDAATCDSYIAKGWADEGIAWYAEASGGRAVYKLTKDAYELLTTSAAEKDALTAAGFTASEADFKVN